MCVCVCVCNSMTFLFKGGVISVVTREYKISHITDIDISLHPSVKIIVDLISLGKERKLYKYGLVIHMVTSCLPETCTLVGR